MLRRPFGLRSIIIVFSLARTFQVSATPIHFMTLKRHLMHNVHFIKGDKRIMSNNILVDYSMEFSVLIVNICDGIKGKSALTNQLLRSGTSIGANIHEANYAQSKADFVSKLQIALKECYESEYWLELFSKTSMISSDVYAKAKNDCGKIRRMLISSINTTKEKYNL